MAFYRICPDCGAYLDPGEQCSCHEDGERRKEWPASPGGIGGKDVNTKRS